MKKPRKPTEPTAPVKPSPPKETYTDQLRYTTSYIELSGFVEADEYLEASYIEEYFAKSLSHLDVISTEDILFEVVEGYDGYEMLITQNFKARCSEDALEEEEEKYLKRLCAYKEKLDAYNVKADKYLADLSDYEERMDEYRVFRRRQEYEKLKAEFDGR